MRRLKTWLMIATLSASFGAGAQTIGSNTAPGQSTAYNLTVSSHLVVETVVVKDKKGNFIKGLTAKDFSVTEDGVPQTVQVVRAPGTADDSVPRDATGPRTDHHL